MLFSPLLLPKILIYWKLYRNGPSVGHVFTNEKEIVTNLSYLPPLGNSDHICLQLDVLQYATPQSTKSQTVHDIL